MWPNTEIRTHSQTCRQCKSEMIMAARIRQGSTVHVINNSVVYIIIFSIYVLTP